MSNRPAPSAATLAVLLPLALGAPAKAHEEGGYILTPQRTLNIAGHCLLSSAQGTTLDAEGCYFILRPTKVWRQPEETKPDTSLPQFCLSYSALHAIPYKPIEQTYCLGNTTPFSERAKANLEDTFKGSPAASGTIAVHQPPAAHVDFTLMPKAEMHLAEESLVVQGYTCISSITVGPTPPDYRGWPRRTTPEEDCKDLQLLGVEEHEGRSCVIFNRPGKREQTIESMPYAHCFKREGYTDREIMAGWSKLDKYLKPQPEQAPAPDR